MSPAKPHSEKSAPFGTAAPQAAHAGEARSSAVMAAGTLVSRFLGFGKTWMLGAALGLGSTVTDTFINANNLPNLIFLLVAMFKARSGPQEEGESDAAFLQRERMATSTRRYVKMQGIGLGIVAVLALRAMSERGAMAARGVTDEQLRMSKRGDPRAARQSRPPRVR